MFFYFKISCLTLLNHHFRVWFFKIKTASISIISWLTFTSIFKNISLWPPLSNIWLIIVCLNHYNDSVYE
jgi:hypothetical protein